MIDADAELVASLRARIAHLEDELADERMARTMLTSQIHQTGEDVKTLVATLHSQLDEARARIRELQAKEAAP